MRECKWCGRQNLNVYAYCQSCGRGWDGPEQADDDKKKKSNFSFWIFGKRRPA
jgi:uncharacterized membrane protein YvbJ